MNKYDDIINLEHYELKNHKRMSMESRAAQFAPFAALTGYSDAVNETARITENKHELDEDAKNKINDNLRIIEEKIKKEPNITVIYFEPDKKKLGGKYIEYTGNIKRINIIENEIVFSNGKKIYLSNIYDIVINL